MTPRASLSWLGRVHVVGIGGAGMSGIARILVARGVTVSGSDAKDSRRITALRALGVDAVVGHDAAHVADVDTVIVSTAIKATNPELLEATARGIRVMGRAEALATVMDGYRGVAVPKSAPEAVRKQVSNLFAQLNADPEMRKRKAAAGFELVDISYEQMPAFVKDRTAAYQDDAKRLGLIK